MRKHKPYPGSRNAKFLGSPWMLGNQYAKGNKGNPNAKGKKASKGTKLKMSKSQRLRFGTAHVPRQHKYNAAQKGIAFLLTFEQWLTIWEKSGHLKDRGRTGYVMARRGDKGAYKIGNVDIVTAAKNSASKQFSHGLDGRFR